MKNLKKLGVFTVAVAIILGILAIGEIDYSISKGLINRSSLFGEFFNLFGELPANLGLLIGTTLLMITRKRDNKILSALGLVLGTLFMGLFSFLASFTAIHYIYEFDEAGMPSYMMIVALIVALGLAIATPMLLGKIGIEKLKRFRSHAGLLIGLVICEILIVNVLKIIWARPRMRSIDSIEQFKYWYQINGPMNSEEFKSFPSGHTANGFVMLAYSMFVPAIDRKKTMGMIGFATLWGICVALSRVILGAHFLSDVVVGGYVTIVAFYVLRMLFLRKKEV